MKILTLDMATKTGWAFYNNGYITSGVMDFSIKRNESRGMRYLRFTAWLREIWKLSGGFGLIAWEAAHHRGAAATQVAHGFLSHLQSFISHRETEMGEKIETTEVHTGTLKKHATGKGNSNKDRMMEAATARGWDYKDDNECDALWLMDYITRVVLNLEDGG